MPSPNKIYQLIASDAERAPSEALLCSKAAVYLVGRYEVAGIRIDKLFLTFYNDVLISMTCEANTELVEALKAKYGEPEVSHTTKDVTCRYTYTGNQVTNKEESFFNKWSNSPLLATYVLMKYYDSSCKANYISSFDITIQESLNEVRECDKSERKRLSEEKRKLKEGSLKDF